METASANVFPVWGGAYVVVMTYSMYNIITQHSKNHPNIHVHVHVLHVLYMRVHVYRFYCSSIGFLAMQNIWIDIDMSR